MRRYAGGEFDLKKDKEILQIDSPRGNVSGPWCVVHKNIDERWAIVLLHFGDKRRGSLKPSIGIRWFNGTTGTPSVKTYATWFILPDGIIKPFLENLPITQQSRQEIYDILSNHYTIDELKAIRKSKYKF